MIFSFELLVIATGLAMDSFTVSVASGFILKRFRWREAGRIALFMGVFQGLMILAGMLLGRGFEKIISDWDHWIAFWLLLILGVRMFIEGFKHESERKFCPLQLRTIVTLAFATSIDALAVGIGFGVLDYNFGTPSLVVGLVAFLFSLLGVFIGERFSSARKFRLEYIGGIILIGIGVKILNEHLHFI
jgi:manganese efflux pump family protein